MVARPWFRPRISLHFWIDLLLVDFKIVVEVVLLLNYLRGAQGHSRFVAMLVESRISSDVGAHWLPLGEFTSNRTNELYSLVTPQTSSIGKFNVSAARSTPLFVCKSIVPRSVCQCFFHCRPYAVAPVHMRSNPSNRTKSNAENNL
nr:uncharacterized protein LOC127338883 [Lolium perenne]